MKITILFRWILKFLCLAALVAVIFYLCMVRSTYFPTQGEIKKKEQEGYTNGNKIVVALNGLGHIF